MFGLMDGLDDIQISLFKEYMGDFVLMKWLGGMGYFNIFRFFKKGKKWFFLVNYLLFFV